MCNDSHGFEEYYAAAEELIKGVGARPHLGKYCESLCKADMARLHGEHFEKFLRIVAEQDPDNKVANKFARRLFVNRGRGRQHKSSLNQHTVTSHRLRVIVTVCLSGRPRLIARLRRNRGVHPSE